MGSYFSIYDAVSPDPTHAVEQGVWGQHVWPWILEQLTPEEQCELDSR